MFFYKVLVSSQRYHGNEPLTYSSEDALNRGQLVVVPLQRQTVVGLVSDKTTKPAFKTKPIVSWLEYCLPITSLQLLTWLGEYYPAPIGAITNLFIPTNITLVPRKESKVSVSAPVEIINLPSLTDEQKRTLLSIDGFPKDQSILLHGDTGTGKTRIYLELASRQLARGSSVLVLTPEIGLTPQLVGSFQRAFNELVVVIHSGLSPGERKKAWLSILEAKQPLVVIGPRSALFSPISKLGLIVVDEMHESAYKQEQAPYYQSLRVAAKLASLHKAQLIMGSATPNVTDYYIAKARGVPILRMKELAVSTSHAKSSVRVISAQNKDHFSRNPYLSNELIESLETTLNHGAQSLIFLNRRGTARLVACQICGWQSRCPNCDLALTYHGDSHSMRCHTCGYKAKAIVHCPICSSTEILYKSIGTKSIVETLEHLFPKARIQRFDTDNKKAERFEQHYDQVMSGKIDILVGTQLITKGLDLPKLAFVGVVTADTNLTFPDYTAEERTYQLLTQIIGRIGRGHIAGQAIIQTHNPESYVIQTAISRDWDTFYADQLHERQKFLFPPFCYLLKLSCTRKTIASCMKSAQALLSNLQQLGLPLRIIGPTPSFYEKSAKGYTWQLVVKAKNRQHLVHIAHFLPAGWSYDLDPTNLL